MNDDPLHLGSLERRVQEVPGSLSDFGSSDESRAGIQYCRMRLPISVPGPTLETSSLSSLASMARRSS